MEYSELLDKLAVVLSQNFTIAELQTLHKKMDEFDIHDVSKKAWEIRTNKYCD